MAAILQSFCGGCWWGDDGREELESMYTFCNELEFRLKDTEEKLTKSTIETENAITRCNTFSQAYEARIEEKDKMIEMLRVSLKQIVIPDIKNGLTNMSREISENQKKEQKSLKQRCKRLENKVDSLRRENEKLTDEIVKLRKTLNKLACQKSKNKCEPVFSTKQELPIKTQWQKAVYKCDQDEVRRLLPHVEDEIREKALFWFVKFDNVELVKLLLDNEKEASVYIGSVMWYAVEKGSEKVCQELVVRKADVNAVDNHGVDLITFCANSTLSLKSRKRVLAILCNSEMNRQHTWVNEEGEEIDLRSYCGLDACDEDEPKKSHSMSIEDLDSLSRRDSAYN